MQDAYSNPTGGFLYFIGRIYFFNCGRIYSDLSVRKEWKKNKVNEKLRFIKRKYRYQAGDKGILDVSNEEKYKPGKLHSNMEKENNQIDYLSQFIKIVSKEIHSSYCLSKNECLS